MVKCTSEKNHKLLKKINKKTYKKQFIKNQFSKT